MHSFLEKLCLDFMFSIMFYPVYTHSIVFITAFVLLGCCMSDLFFILELLRIL